MENKGIYKCSKCLKTYKSKLLYDKHSSKCVDEPTQTATFSDMNQKPKENTYDVNMVFLEGNKVQLDVKKQLDDCDDDGEQVLKDILKPKVSETYQEEIDKLESLVEMFKNIAVPDDESKKDALIAQLKNTITILMTQSQSLIKEMKKMSHRNSYFKNNIMLASFILDKCRHDVPESDEDFENMYSS
jgi:hypothetical protein